MLIALDHFFLMVLFTKPWYMELSTCKGVGCCRCLSYVSVVQMGGNSRAVLKAVDISASMVELMIFFIMMQMK